MYTCKSQNFTLLNKLLIKKILWAKFKLLCYFFEVELYFVMLADYVLNYSDVSFHLTFYRHDFDELHQNI